jgi:hypothetical protein
MEMSPAFPKCTAMIIIINSAHYFGAIPWGGNHERLLALTIKTYGYIGFANGTGFA